MTTDAIVQAARSISHGVHATQKRRDGRPYIQHPMRVAAALEDSGYSAVIIAAGWLHDAIEDSKDTNPFGTYRLIKAQCGAAVADIVSDLTRLPGDDYGAYTDAILRSKAATIVKVMDVVDNLSDDPGPEAKERYRAFLIKAMPALGNRESVR